MMDYPLASSSWDDMEREAILRVIDSGRHTMGGEVAAYEKAFAETTGSRFAVMVNSGSSANLLMAAALRYSKGHQTYVGDEVLAPAVSWPTTYYPFTQYGFRLKLVDVDPQTLNYDLNALDKAITPSTRVIVVVNLLGNPNEFSEIASLTKGRDIILLEDNCEGLGSSYCERSTGTFGAMGTFSTFFSHHMSTMEGGVVVTDSEELHHILLCLRAHGWTRDLPPHNLVCGEKAVDPFKGSFEFVLPGYNVRPLEIEGAVGRVQLGKLPGFIAARRRNASIFRNRFVECKELLLQREIGRSSWFGFSLICNRGGARDGVARRLRESGIACRPICAGNFAKTGAARHLGISPCQPLPGADLVDENGLFVGNHHYLLHAEIEHLWTVVDGLCKEGVL